MGFFSRKPREVSLNVDANEVPVAGTGPRQKAVPRIGVYQFEIRAEPTNSYDRNAVMVLYRGKHVGYIPAEQAAGYSRALGTKRIGVQGEVRTGRTGRWILLRLPPAEALRAL